MYLFRFVVVSLFLQFEFISCSLYLLLSSCRYVYPSLVVYLVHYLFRYVFSSFFMSLGL